MKIRCHQCKKEFEKCTGHINRAIKMGLNIYCNKKCAGIGRRNNLSIEEKKKLKSEYDKIYTAKNLFIIKAKRHEYFKKTYNPEQAAIERKKKMPKHVEYCRQPKYRAYKKEYDKVYRAKKLFGEFWESGLLILDIESHYNQQEVREGNNLHNKTQKRKRKWQQLQKLNYLQAT